MKRKILFMAASFIALLSINLQSFAQCSPSQSELTLTIDFSGDGFSDEDGWRLIDITNGITVDSACFGTYATSTGIETIIFCVDTGNVYQVLAYDDFGDGLDGSVWTISYTYGATISTFGANNINFANALCNPAYTNNEIADTSIAFTAIFVPVPACLAPMANSGTTNLTLTSAQVSWVELGTATSWLLEWDTAGYATGSARNSKIVNDTSGNTFTTLTGLMGFTNYDWYVRALCSPTDSSSLDGSSFFTGHCSVSTTNTSDYLSSVASVGASTNISYTASTQPSGSYANAKSQILSSFPGATFNINTNYVGGNNGVTIWVDWNNDLDFDDLGEQIGNSSGTAAHTIAVNMPAMAALGNYTMRVRGQWNATNPPACGNVDYGSTVDFTLSIMAPPACLAPSSAARTNITSSSVTLNWIENGTATQWEVEYGTTGFMQGTGTLTTVNVDTFINITGLMPQTGYSWYVRAICGPSNNSAWTSVSSFTTPCAPLVAPILESFNAATLPNCWARYQTTGSGWVFGTPGFSWNNSGCAASTPVDHTGNAGRYAAMDFSVPDAGTVLELPTVDVSALTAPYLKFYFTMCGNGYTPLNVLYIETFNGSNWSLADSLRQGTSGWEEFGFVLTPYVYDTTLLKVRFRAESGGSTLVFYGDMAIDDVSIEEAPSCPDPSNVSAFNTTATSSEVTWQDNSSASSWLLEWDTAGYAAGTANNNMVVTNDTATITGLMQSTAYDWNVRAICAVGDSSNAIAGSFMTPATCPAPSALSANSLSFDVAQLNWTDNSTAMSWEIEYGTSGFTLGTGTSVITSTNPDTISGLMSNTTYSWYVRALCSSSDSSTWTGPNNFTTPCSSFIPNYTEDFTSYVPSCWTEAKGQLTANTVFTSTTSSFWQADGFLNVGTTGSARMNIFSTGRFEWLISPSIDLGTAPNMYRLEFDAGLTDFTGSGTDLMGPDDTLSVVISTDNGATWSSANVVKLYDVNAPPSNTGETVFIDLSVYTGVIKVGFYATSITSNTDYNVYIDNFRVRVPPVCVAPTANAASSITANSALASWVENGTATQWELEYGAAGYTIGSGTSTIVNVDTFTTISGLMLNTSYDYYVRAICGAGDTSIWSSVTTFTTPCGIETAPFFDGFENFATVSGLDGTYNCWTATRDNTTNDWNIDDNGSTPSGGTGPVGPYAGSKYLFFEASGGATNNSGSLITPPIDVSGLTVPMVEFYYHMFGDNRGGMGNLYVDIIDGAVTTTVDSLINEQQFAQADPWLRRQIFLPTIGDTIQVVLRGTRGTLTQWGDISVDDFAVKEAPTCPDPSNLGSFNVLANSADVTWQDNSTATSWLVEWDTAGYAAGTARNSTVATNDTFMLTGLMQLTNYDWTVKAICGTADSSVNVSGSFVTPATCPAPVANAGTNNLTLTTAEVSWIENFSATSWRVEWDTLGYAAGTARNTMLVTDTFAILTGLTADTDYDWNVRALCSGTDSSTLVGGSFYTNYCLVTSTNANSYFDDFTTSNGATNISNTASGYATNGYQDATNLSVSQFATGVVDFNTTLVGTTVGVNIWVDWNNDLTFDVSELVYASGSYVSTASGTITVPAGTPVGNYRMRARCDFNATNPNACGTSGSGRNETEDYTFTVIAPPSCLPTTPNAATALTATSAIVSWIENGTATEWEVEYDTAGFTPGTGRNVVQVLTDTFRLLSGLTPSTGYDWYMRAVCSAMDSSTYTGGSFRTDFLPAQGVNCTSGTPTVIFSEEFDNNSAGWTGNIGSAGGNWEIPNNATSLNTGADVAYSGANYMNFESSGGTSGSIISPAIDLTNAQGDAELSFWLHAYGAAMGDLTVGISTSATGPFTNVFSISGQIQTAGSDPWLNAGINLASYIGQTIYVEFNMSNYTSYTSDMSIDLFEVSTCVTPPTPYYPIATINTEDTTGVADSIGVTCWTSGTVVGIDLDGNVGLSFTIIDMSSGSQEGMNIFNFNDVSNYVVTEGDSIMVRGSILQFRGLTELSPDSIVVLSTGNAIPTPLVVTDLDETTESKYLSIPTSYWSLGSVTGTGGSFNLDLTNGTDTITMRVDSDTEIRDSLAASPAGGINVGDTICGLLGVGGQFSSTTTAPFLNGYQIFPMRWSDLSICRLAVGINDVDAEEAQFMIVPNPTSGLFEIRTTGFDNPTVNVTIRDINGRIVSNEFINNANNSFNKTFNLDGESKGVYFISITDGNNVINEKLIVQ